VVSQKPLAYPQDALGINVREFGAKGDGVTDDTLAIQKALDQGRDKDQDYYGRPKSLYFPAGTYRVSNTLRWKGCCVSLYGQGAGATILKLQDNAAGFNDPQKPKAVILTPAGNASFRQNIRDLTVETGRNNPGAIGIDYIANNSGTLQNVVIKSGDGKGAIGLAMNRQWPGPCLIKTVQIEGFDYGIWTLYGEYGVAMENIGLVNQNKVGIFNEGNSLAIRKLQSLNQVPAIKNGGAAGLVILLDSKLQGGSNSVSAIDNAGHLYARNLTTSGYQSAVKHQGNVVPGANQTDYSSGKTYSLFPSPPRSLGLPIQETPEIHDNNLSNWGRFNPGSYGDNNALQPTLNSGKSTIYFSHGNYLSSKPTVVTVPATVQRIIGFGSGVNEGGIVFRVAANSTKPLVIEQFGYGVTIEHDSQRPVVIKNGFYGYKSTPAAGNLFLEDVGLAPLEVRKSQSVWARQLNSESLGKPFTKITNTGGKLWILGLKTEGRGTVIATIANGFTEMLGTVIYPVEAFSERDLQQPAFVNTESHHSLIYSLLAYKPDQNYGIQVQETRGGVVRKFLTQDFPGVPGVMPLFTGHR
jgi:hypothetical protein